MMQGALYRLSQDSGVSLLGLKELRGGMGFYIAGKTLSHDEELRAVTDGIFYNVTPEDSWYHRIAEGFLSAKITPSPVPEDRGEAIRNVLTRLSDYVGQTPPDVRIKNAVGFDAITYHAVSPDAAIPAFCAYTAEDPAFYLYGAYKRASHRSHEGFHLSDDKRRLLCAMAFLEADLLRAVVRGDTSVIVRRAKRCAALFYEVDDPDETGRAFCRFLEIIFGLFGSNALQDEKFVL